MSDDRRKINLPKIGLVLGSGVARGWAHIGVIRALERAGVKPDLVAGTSIGSVVAGTYLAGELDALEAWAMRMSKVRMLSYMDFRVRAGGMIGGRHILDDLRQELGDMTFADLPIPLTMIATDLVTGHEVWLRKGDLIESMRASFSLPGVFPPVQVDGRWLIDGALVNPVPVSACQALGAQMTIAVNVNADILGKQRQPDDSSLVGGGLDIIQELEKANGSYAESKVSTFARRLFRRESTQPSMFGVMISSLGIVQDRITRSRLAGEPPDVHITPRLGHIGLFEFYRAKEIIEEGEAAVERVLPDIRDALAIFAGNGSGSIPVRS